MCSQQHSFMVAKHAFRIIDLGVCATLLFVFFVKFENVPQLLYRSTGNNLDLGKASRKTKMPVGTLHTTILQVVDRLLTELTTVAELAYRTVPGARVLAKYIQNSYQNDPIRIVVELLLLAFAVVYLTAKRYRPDTNDVQLTEKVCRRRRTGHRMPRPNNDGGGINDPGNR
jgi:hypothetical protein